jgi:GAF domain-containing protein
VYLENNLAEGTFTPKRLDVLNVLSSQLAISIENALLYRTLEQKVEERTAQLAEANQ